VTFTMPPRILQTVVLSVDDAKLRESPVRNKEDEMHFVVLGTHSPEICPLSNAKTNALLLEVGPQIPNIAKQHGVNIVAGPYVNREHMTVVIVEAESAEDLDAFLETSRLHQWNKVRILPSFSMEEGMRDLQEANTLF